MGLYEGMHTTIEKRDSFARLKMNGSGFRSSLKGMVTLSAATSSRRPVRLNWMDALLGRGASRTLERTGRTIERAVSFRSASVKKAPSGGRLKHMRAVGSDDEGRPGGKGWIR